MALTPAQKQAAGDLFFRLVPEASDHWGKSLLKQVADAVITWKTDNGASYNAALPDGFRGAGSTLDEKAAMLIACLAAERDMEI